MECREITERVSAYIDGETGAAEAREVEKHLDECPPCRTLERRMRSVGSGIERIETEVPPGFRERLFAQMEAEDLLPRRRSLFAFSVRWAAVPLAAAVALAFFLLGTPEKVRELPAPQGTVPQVARKAPAADPAAVHSEAEAPRAPSSPPGVPRQARVPAVAAALSPEERDIVANLDLLEDPMALDEPGEVDELEIFGQTSRGRG